MKKLIYILMAVVCLLSASSCKKNCVQCSAVDKRGVTVNTSTKVCEHDFNRKNFEDRYAENFKDYTTNCISVD
ncbi:MAG: hypothetical protein JWO03_3525 [Bacteroidetes bacterium]|nr:hypothetical protein [Bacteroidota bacterium]